MCYVHVRDETQIKEWVEASTKPETTQAYLDKYIYSVQNHAEYLEKIGWERLEKLRIGGESDGQPCI
jgi:glutaconate CoA-transferase subunit A